MISRGEFHVSTSLSPDFLIYCERLEPGLRAEPVNLVSNAGFLAVSAWALYRCRNDRLGFRQSDIWFLGILILAIGAGSGLWHSFHTEWAEALDILPILSFIHLYLFSFLYRRVGWHPSYAVAATALFFGASKLYGSAIDPAWLNGSVFYLPALIVLAALTGWSYGKAMPAWPLMGTALAIFMVSLVFRTLDAELCRHVPVGTHFLWHLFNAVLLGILFEVVRRVASKGGVA